MARRCDAMTILTASAIVVGVITIIARAAIRTLIGAVLAIPFAGLIGWVLATAFDQPEPFTAGPLPGAITAGPWRWPGW